MAGALFEFLVPIGVNVEMQKFVCSKRTTRATLTGSYLPLNGSLR
jgi:hypothetical protein